MMVAITAPSKTFNLAGGQNSIVIIPDDKLRKKWDTFVDGIRVRSGNPFGYIAAEAAYRTGASWLESVKAQIRENEAYVRETFEKEDRCFFGCLLAFGSRDISWMEFLDK